MQQSTQIARFSTRPVVLSSVVIWLLLAAHPGMLVASTRYPISKARIADTLVTYGLTVAPEHIRLPLAITAVSDSPRLELISSRVAAPDLLQFELRCHDSGQCLPFFVLIDVAPGAASALVAEVRKGERSQPGAQANSQAAQVRPENVQSSRDRMRAGSHITLLLEDGQMRIQLPAVALDSGAPGLEVRVCTMDHHKTFLQRL